MILLFALIALVLAEEPVPELVDLVPDNPSYQTARKRLYADIYVDHRVTFYCDCEFSEEKVIDLGSCGMKSILSRRAKVLEAEHVVPASVFGRTRPCWDEAELLGERGRDYCEKHDQLFKEFYADLHNLVPSVGSVNGARSDLGYGMIEGEDWKFKGCDFEVDRKAYVVEIAPHRRGDAARKWRYIADRYNMPLTEEQKRLLLWWNDQDPVDEQERKLDALIKTRQGNSNPFIH